MKKNLHEIELVFYRVFRREMSISEFENWLYNADEDTIDEHFGNGFYFKLIDLNYKDKYIFDNLSKIIYDKINFGKFEKMRMMNLLNCIIANSADLVETLELCYELYCRITGEFEYEDFRSKEDRTEQNFV